MHIRFLDMKTTSKRDSLIGGKSNLKKLKKGFGGKGLPSFVCNILICNKAKTDEFRAF